MNNEGLSKKYGLFTAASLVVGIVIGSGIFFKADDVLINTRGSVILGIVGFLIIGLGVINSALVISQYTLLDKDNGGMMGYAKMAFGQKFGFVFGLIMTTVYFPALIVILAFVLSIYLNEFYISISGNEESFFSNLNIVLVIVLSLSYILNLLNAKLAGYLQSVTTITKMVPLIIVGFVGVLGLVDSGQSMTIDPEIAKGFTPTANEGLFLSLISIAFTFDGWIVATTIAGELKNPKKNLPLALVGGVILITTIYVLYFVGMSNIVGPEQIINVGDKHPGIAAEMIFGKFGPPVFFLFICISVLGALNGMVLGYMRLSHSLVKSKTFNNRLGLGKVNEKLDMPVRSALICIPYLILFYILHLNGFAIDSIPMAAVYILYSGLYLGAFKFIKQGKVAKKYAIFATIAIIVSVLVLYGSRNNLIVYLIITVLCMSTLSFLYNKDGK